MCKVDLLRLWAGAYFVAQFLVVHVVLFGWTFEPVDLILRAPAALNWRGISAVVMRIWEPLVGGLSFGSVVALAILSGVYLVWLLWECRLIILYGFVLWQFVWFCVIKLRQVLHVRRIALDNVVVIKAGAPGCGKSSSGLYEAVVMARKMWRRLQYRYFTYSARVRKWRRDKTKYALKLAEWEEIKFSYNYFRRRGADCGTTRNRWLFWRKRVDGRADVTRGEERKPVVPCLVTNIPVIVGGRFTCRLTKKHLAQKKRLPAYSVLFVDEIGAMLNVDMWKQRAGKDPQVASVVVDVDNMFRLCRHFGEFRIVCTEQQRDNIYKGVRNVVSKVEVMQSQTWVLKPYPLFVAFAVAKFAVMRRNKSNDEGKRIWNRLTAPWLLRLEKLTYSVGFRRYKYKTESGAQGLNATVLKGTRTFYLESMLNFSYDERTYRNLYNCKNQPVDPEPWESLVIEDTTDNRDNFLRVVVRQQHHIRDPRGAIDKGGEQW